MRAKTDRSAYHRAWYQANRERLAAQKKKYRLLNRERIKTQSAEYYQRIKDRQKKWMAEWYLRNREKVLLATKKWSLENPEKVKKRFQKYELLHRETRRMRRPDPERQKISAKRYRLAHPEMSRVYVQKRKALKRKLLVGDVREIYRWIATWRNKPAVKCHWCGQMNPGNTCHADHVIPLSKGGPHSRDNLVVSCFRCNIKKGDQLPEVWLKNGAAKPLANGAAH